jgi:hypothetical protein
MSHQSNQVNQPSTPSGSSAGLFSVRAVVLMLAAAVIGGTIGVLTYLAGQPVAAAIVAGVISAGATLAAAHRLVD